MLRREPRRIRVVRAVTILVYKNPSDIKPAAGAAGRFENGG